LGSSSNLPPAALDLVTTQQRNHKGGVSGGGFFDQLVFKTLNFKFLVMIAPAHADESVCIVLHDVRIA